MTITTGPGGYTGPLGKTENIFTGIAQAVQPETESFKKFTEGLQSKFEQAMDPGGIGSVASDVGEVVNDYATGKRGPWSVVEELQTFGENLAQGIDEGDTFLPKGTASAVKELLPDIADTAALGLSSKLLNSAMGVAGGTAGQAVGKVSVPDITPTELKGEIGHVNLPHPVAALKKVAEKGGR